MSEEYGDDFNMVFVEVQGADDRRVEQFALGKKWLGKGAMWTTERPFNVGMQGIPHFALLDASGEVILKGYSTREHSKVVELVESEIKALTKGPKDLPKSLRKPWKSFAKGDYAKGVAEAQEVSVDGGDDAEDAQQLVKSFERRIEGMIKRAKWMIENGYLLEADDFVDTLVDGLEGLDEAFSAATELRESLDSDEMKDEMDAAKKLSRLEQQLFDKGSKAKGFDKKLEKFADKYSGTKAAARASHLADLI